MPLVSIITPVYNAAQFLPEMLASVRAQTLTDWEHLLVDDRSTDSSLEILGMAAAADPRIRRFRTAHNSGPSAARNLALKAARGRFIAYLDADDVWLPLKLARSVQWMTTYGYSFVYHDYRHISYDGSSIGEVVRGPETLNLRTLHTRRGTGGCMSMVFDREQIHDLRFPEADRAKNEDFCAWLRIVKQGHIGHRLPCELGRYRLSTDSRSGNKLANAREIWKSYRTASGLSLLRAFSWWTQYAWNTYWLYRNARPCYDRSTGGVPKTVAIEPSLANLPSSAHASNARPALQSVGLAFKSQNPPLRPAMHTAPDFMRSLCFHLLLKRSAHSIGSVHYE